jgi:hypothetical protein
MPTDRPNRGESFKLTLGSISIVEFDSLEDVGNRLIKRPKALIEQNRGSANGASSFE